nr:MAG TPA: hypothetical protein [Caudoviricetes sp.]
MSLDVRGLSSRAVSIRASRMVNDRVAKVLIAYYGKCTPEFIENQIAQQLNGLGAVVEGSFKEVAAEGVSGRVAVGYVRVNREVRMPTQAELRASYRVLSSNILMSNDDRTLWEVKKGKNATYLARHGNEDLSELLELCTAKVTPNSSERAALNASVRPEQYDFVSFVNECGDRDYGFVLASSDKKTKVVSYNMKTAVVVPNDAVLSSVQCTIDPILAKAVKRKVEADTKDGSVADMEDYYRTLFSYDPDYMQEFIDDVKALEKSIA